MPGNQVSENLIDISFWLVVMYARHAQSLSLSLAVFGTNRHKYPPTMCLHEIQKGF